jgi:hypothetical protein
MPRRWLSRSEACVSSILMMVRRGQFTGRLSTSGPNRADSNGAKQPVGRVRCKLSTSRASRVTVTTTPSPPTSESADEEAVAAIPRADDAAPRPRPAARGDRSALPPAALGPKLPRIVRPRGLNRAVRPADVPQPEHHHLPGWVRRVHGQARPILADLLGSLDGEPRQQYDSQVRELVGSISSGKFSQAWQYPKLIDDGQALLEEHRRGSEEEAKRRRGLETVRKRVSEQLRDQGGRLTPETSTRLQRSLRSANELTAVREVESELDQALSSARTVEERRRDREIDKTRERIRRSLPPGREVEPPAESWQDVLRRIADQYSE